MAMITVNDVLTWGRLVKSWARQLNYIGRVNPAPPPFAAPVVPPTGTIPSAFNYPGVMTPPDFTKVMSRQDFEALIARVAASPDVVPPLPNQPDGSAGLLLELPPEIEWVTFVQGTEKHLVIRLPPAAIVEQTENDLLTGGYYGLRSFYAELFTCPGGCAVQENTPATSDAKMTLHAERIGDYTISYCQ